MRALGLRDALLVMLCCTSLGHDVAADVFNSTCHTGDALRPVPLGAVLPNLGSDGAHACRPAPDALAIRRCIRHGCRNLSRFRLFGQLVGKRSFGVARRTCVEKHAARSALTVPLQCPYSAHWKNAQCPYIFISRILMESSFLFPVKKT